MSEEPMCFYYPAINEDGWQVNGEPVGYRPDLDESHIYIKVHGILGDLHDHNFLYISNGMMGDVVAEHVVKRCKEEEQYDQYSIIRFIYEDPNIKSHEEYWQKKHKDQEA